MADFSIGATCAQSNVVQEIRAFIEREDALDTFHRHVTAIIRTIQSRDLIDSSAAVPDDADILHCLIDVIGTLAAAIPPVVLLRDDADAALDTILEMVGGAE